MKKRELLNEVVQLMRQLKEELDNTPKKYYRNKHLRQYFGFSDNTISDYRDKNILPWEKLGSIYFYPIDKVHESLRKNSNLDLIENQN